MQNALDQAKQARRKNGELVRTFLDDYVDIGIKQGREEGREEGALLLVLAQLNRRFGPLSQRLQNRVRRLSLEQITELGEAIFDFHSRKDISAWLQAHEG